MAIARRKAKKKASKKKVVKRASRRLKRDREITWREIRQVQVLSALQRAQRSFGPTGGRNYDQFHDDYLPAMDLVELGLAWIDERVFTSRGDIVHVRLTDEGKERGYDLGIIDDPELISSVLQSKGGILGERKSSTRSMRARKKITKRKAVKKNVTKRVRR